MIKIALVKSIEEGIGIQAEMKWKVISLSTIETYSNIIKVQSLYMKVDPIFRYNYIMRSIDFYEKYRVKFHSQIKVRFVPIVNKVKI